jgi:hypothetical protein
MNVPIASIPGPLTIKFEKKEPREKKQEKRKRRRKISYNEKGKD